MEELTVEQWQERFDSDFPRGAIAELEYGDREDDPYYQIPVIRVIEMNGIMPLVFLPVLDTSKSFVFSIASYTFKGTTAEVITSEGIRWNWDSTVPDELAEVMVPIRDLPIYSREFLAMIVLGHFDPNTGVLYGIWKPPRKEDGLPEPYYPSNPDKENLAAEAVGNKGSDPTWEEWFDQLGESLPYTTKLESFDVDGSLPAEDVFTEVLYRAA